jgi:molecular chaperone GrpE
MKNNKEDIGIKEEGKEPSEAAEDAKEAAEDLPIVSDQTGEIESLKSEIEKKSQQAKENHDKYVRLYAEFENYKKRMVKDQAEFLKSANERLIRDILPVIDNLERAVEHAKEPSEVAKEELQDIKGLIAGIELTIKQFKDVLGSLGVEEVKSVGEPFDPSRHEAVSHIETDKYDNNIVINEFQKGYILNNRILRPAMVSVAKKLEKKEDVEVKEDTAFKLDDNEQNEER